MDKKRAAMRQIKAIEAHGERLAAIEQALTAPQAIDADSLELAPGEPLATAAQIAALAEKVDRLLEKVDQIVQAPVAPPPATPQPNKK